MKPYLYNGGDGKWVHCVHLALLRCEFFLYKLIFKIIFARYLIVRHGMSILDPHLINFFLSRNRDRPPSKQWPEVIVRIIHKTLHKITSIFFQALGDAAFSFKFEGSEMVSCTDKCIRPSEGIPL